MNCRHPERFDYPPPSRQSPLWQAPFWIAMAAMLIVVIATAASCSSVIHWMLK